MTLHFDHRGLSNAQIAAEFNRSVATEAFCNIGHDRDAGPLNLVSQPKVLAKLPSARGIVDLHCELSSLLPTLDVLEARDNHRE